MASLDRDITSCATYVQDTEDAKLRAAQKLTVAKLSEDLTNHRLAYRRAVLKAQQNNQTAQALNRDLLFGRAGKSTASLINRREERGNNAVLQASGDVTAELRRTHAMMSEELSRSALAQELLQGSSNSLKMLNEEYTAFDTILAGSKRLIRELERADKMDRWLILGALGFFVFVVAFILYKRIFSKGVNVVWWVVSHTAALLSGKKKDTVAIKGQTEVKMEPVITIEGALPVSQALKAEGDALLQGAQIPPRITDDEDTPQLKDEL
jgi:protein transport protein SEC20